MTLNSLHSLARDGDQSAEGRLFQGLTESFRIFSQQRIWNEQDCEEIVQDSLTAIAAKYRAIDFEISFAAWAYRVLENNILNYLRSSTRRQRRLEKLTEMEKQKTSVSPDPLLKRRLLDCLKKVNEKNIRHARILNFKYQGYSLEQICQRLNLNRNSAYILLSRARKTLKDCLDRKGNI